MTATIWRESRARFGHMQRNGKREMVTVLRCDAVNGLLVRTGECADFNYHGRSLPTYGSGRVVIESTGYTIGPMWYGWDDACKAAAALAPLYDWSAMKAGDRLPESVQAACAYAINPIADANSAAYQQFLAEHKAKDEAEAAAFAATQERAA